MTDALLAVIADALAVRACCDRCGDPVTWPTSTWILADPCTDLARLLGNTATTPDTLRHVLAHAHLVCTSCHPQPTPRSFARINARHRRAARCSRTRSSSHPLNARPAPPHPNLG